MADRNELWTMTAIGVLVAAATAVVTGLVVANRAGVDQQAQAAAPPAAPATGRVASAPPRSATEACNRQAAAQVGDQRDRTGTVIEAGKGAGIKKPDARFRSAYSSCMKSRGYSA